MQFFFSRIVVAVQFLLITKPFENRVTQIANKLTNMDKSKMFDNVQKQKITPMTLTALS